MREIYQVLTALEGLSVQFAASREHKNGAFEAAEQAIFNMDAALKNDDREAWTAADEDFHNELVQLSGNGRIAAIVAICNDQVRRARSVTLHLRPSPEQPNDDHSQVLAAIREGDGEKAKICIPSIASGL